jgi:hypothetical protein
VRPAHAAVLAHTAPPRAPHVKSCIPACRLRRELESTHVTGCVTLKQKLEGCDVECS